MGTEMLVAMLVEQIARCFVRKEVASPVQVSRAHDGRKIMHSRRSVQVCVYGIEQCQFGLGVRVSGGKEIVRTSVRAGGDARRVDLAIQRFTSRCCSMDSRAEFVWRAVRCHSFQRLCDLQQGVPENCRDFLHTWSTNGGYHPCGQPNFPFFSSFH